MSTYGPFGGSSSFYSEPHPENVGNAPPDNNTIESKPVENRGEFERAQSLPDRATPPAYTHYSASADDFAPSTLIDPEVTGENAGVMQPAAPSMGNLAVFAGLAFLAFLALKAMDE